MDPENNIPSIELARYILTTIPLKNGLTRLSIFFENAQCRTQKLPTQNTMASMRFFATHKLIEDVAPEMALVTAGTNDCVYRDDNYLYRALCNGKSLRTILQAENDVAMSLYGVATAITASADELEISDNINGPSYDRPYRFMNGTETDEALWLILLQKLNEALNKQTRLRPLSPAVLKEHLEAVFGPVEEIRDLVPKTHR